MTDEMSAEILVACAPDSRAVVARQLWAARRDITEQLVDEVLAMREEGFMLTEIARAIGAPGRTLHGFIQREIDQRRELRGTA